MRKAAILSLTCVLAGCGSSGGGDGDGGIPGATLVVTPVDPVLEVVNGAAPEQIFTATIMYSDGTTQDVSANATWTIDTPDLGTFTDEVFRPTGIRGGQGMVRASWSGTSGTTGVTVRIRTVRVVDPAPPNAPDLFDGATEDVARAPALVYPSDRTMVPPNLGDFEVHWSNAAGNDLFKVTLGSSAVELSVYLLFPIPSDPATLWTAFTPDEWAVARDSSRGGSLKLSVRGMLSAMPATAGSSPQFAIRVADEDLEGGIYYWAASASGIYRHDFGQPGQPPQAFYSPTESGGRCVACHALSRDGTKMAVTFDGGDGAATVIDVATRTPFFPGDGSVRSNFTVFNPDATRMLMTSAGGITLRDPTTAAVLGTVPTTGYATHPDWSPQGDLITYVAVGGPSGYDWHFAGGRIVVQPYDGGTDTFGAPIDLVPTDPSGNLYYPTFSPDGQWILYNRSVEDAYDDGSAEIYVVRIDGTVAPFLLSTPNVSGGLTNSWARWAPFEQTTTGETPEALFWFTFSSKRAFGVRLGAGRPQVWMAPFFPSRTGDPSLPAFRLPFQDLATSNHIAQWTEVVVPVGAPAP